MQIEMRRNGLRCSAGQRNERFLCRLFRSGLLRRRCCFRVDPNCRGRDSCGTGAMVERLLLLLRLRLCTGLAFLRYRTLGRGFCCRASLRPARFLRYRSDAVMLPIAAGAAGFLLCRSGDAAETGDVCATVCGVGFSALPPCAGIGRCEACCSAGRAASGRAVERGGVPASRLEDGAAGDTGVVGAGCSRFVERPSMRLRWTAAPCRRTAGLKHGSAA